MFRLYAHITLVALLCSAPLLASVSFVAHAQQTGSDPLFIDVQPKSPSPGAQTTITIDSSTYDLSQATIRWTVNGAPAAAGSGVRTFTFTVGAAGETTVVGLTVVPLRGTPFTRTFTFRPGSVLLLWEAHTYTPPFFVGKSLYSPGADIKVFAVTDVRDAAGRQTPPSDLTFKWRMNGDPYADRSGLGRDVLTFTGAWQGGVEEVAVDVLRKDGTIAARGAVFIKSVNPKILFYKKDPLRGTLYAHAFTENTRLGEVETTIVAEPYYVSGKSRKGPTLAYRWTLNEKPIDPQGEDPAILTLRQTGAQSGNATLSLSIQNVDNSKLLQAADAAVTLMLGAQNASFFGF